MTNAHRSSCYLSVIKAVLWICIGFNADPDPAFYLSADPDPDQGSQPKADPWGSGSGSWSDFEVTKNKIFPLKNILKVTRVRRYKSLF
jgi:hypothetical protein